MIPKKKNLPIEGKQYPYSYIESLVVDSAGNVWVGTTTDGLYKFDPYIEKYTHYPPNQNNYNDPGVMSLMFDKEGILWIGTKGSHPGFRKTGGRQLFCRMECGRCFKWHLLLSLKHHKRSCPNKKTDTFEIVLNTLPFIGPLQCLFWRGYFYFMKLSILVYHLITIK